MVQLFKIDSYIKTKIYTGYTHEKGIEMDQEYRNISIRVQYITGSYL